MTGFLHILMGCMLFLGNGEPLLPWSAERKLTWDDFGGMPDEASKMQAHTHTRLKVHWDCEGGDLVVEARAAFDLEQSWTRNVRSKALLAHEQLHFDLAELYARKVRRHFDRLDAACGHDARADVQALLDEWQAAERAYDAETRHSLDHAQQSAWGERIATELKALEAYAVD